MVCKQLIKMPDWAILLPGDLVMTPRLRGQIARARIIAADAGIRHAALMPRDPQSWIGDFDSASPRDLESLGHIPRQRYPADKDATDGALAVQEALRLGARKIILLGAFGGDPAHVQAHMTQIAALSADGITAMATDGREEAWGLAPGHQQFDFPPGARFSIIGFSTLEGLSIEGAKWPMHHAHIPFGSTRTLSNVVTEKPLSIGLTSGTGLLIASLSQPA